MRLDFHLIIGNWKIERWHLWQWRKHQAVKNKSITWVTWDKVL